jgi:hypothetical protein
MKPVEVLLLEPVLVPVPLLLATLELVSLVLVPLVLVLLVLVLELLEFVPPPPHADSAIDAKTQTTATFLIPSPSGHFPARLKCPGWYLSIVHISSIKNMSHAADGAPQQLVRLPHVASSRSDYAPFLAQHDIEYDINEATGRRDPAAPIALSTGAAVW